MYGSVDSLNDSSIERVRGELYICRIDVSS